MRATPSPKTQKNNLIRNWFLSNCSGSLMKDAIVVLLPIESWGFARTGRSTGRCGSLGRANSSRRALGGLLRYRHSGYGAAEKFPTSRIYTGQHSLKCAKLFHARSCRVGTRMNLTDFFPASEIHCTQDKGRVRLVRH